MDPINIFWEISSKIWEIWDIFTKIWEIWELWEIWDWWAACVNVKKISNNPVFFIKLSHGMYINVLKVPIDRMCASDVLLTFLIYPCQTHYRLKTVVQTRKQMSPTKRHKKLIEKWYSLLCFDRWFHRYRDI